MTAILRIAALLSICLILAGCERDDNAIDPLDPDPARTDTVTVAEPEGHAGFENAAQLASVGDAAVSGIAMFQDTGEAVQVLVEAGPLGEDGHYHVFILDRRTCEGIQHAENIAHDLGDLTVADDGTGRLEDRVAGIRMEGPDGIRGHAAVIADDDGRAMACGIVERAMH